jgi:hypothetical protein
LQALTKLTNDVRLHQTNETTEQVHGDHGDGYCGKELKITPYQYIISRFYRSGMTEALLFDFQTEARHQSEH